MITAVRKVSELPEKTRLSLVYFGKMLGRFDVEGQRQGIEATESEVNRFLKELSDNQEVRLRSYQTLALCVGAAIVILFI
jgi:stage III sporulation protein AB